MTLTLTTCTYTSTWLGNDPHDLSHPNARYKIASVAEFLLLSHPVAHVLHS